MTPNRVYSKGCERMNFVSLVPLKSFCVWLTVQFQFCKLPVRFGVVHIASVSLSVKWRIYLPPKAISGNHNYKPFSTACSSQLGLGACTCMCGPLPPAPHGARLTLLIKAYHGLTVSPSNTRGRMHFLKKNTFHLYHCQDAIQLLCVLCPKQVLIHTAS